MKKPTKENEYEAQARKFLESMNTTFTIALIGTYKYFPDDKEKRDVYSFTLANDKHHYTANFGDSIDSSTKRAGTYHPPHLKTRYDLDHARRKEMAKHKKPSAYDILACMTSCDPGTFSDFCCDFGYDEDSRQALKTYLDVQKEFNGMCRLFTLDELEALSKIQ